MPRRLAAGSFTKTVNVSGTVTAGTITIGADDYYEASLHDMQFAKVSDLNSFLIGNEDVYDLSKILHAGSNTLVITLHNTATGVTASKANRCRTPVQAGCDADEHLVPLVY